MSKSDVVDLPVGELIPHFDLYDHDHHGRLWEVLAYARQECPVIKTDADEGYFIITRYDDLRAVAGDPETFSSEQPALRGTPVRMPPVSEDPPLHQDFRRILNPYFARPFLGGYEESIRATARELLEPLTEQGHMEFMNDFSLPFTAQNLAQVVLGESNKERIARARTAALKISTVGDQQAFIDLAAIAAEFLRDRCESGIEQDDLLSAIIHGTVQGRPLTLEEQVGICTTLFSGGLDTVRGALGNITRRLATDPGMESRLRDPDWVRTDLDELLRLETPITYLARTVTKDTEVHGCPMKTGDRLALHFASANRDKDAFEHPDELDFHRERNPHVAFGVGIHRCLGLHFARLQIRIGIEEILDRITNLRVPEGEQVELSNGVILTPEHLPLEFDVRSSTS